MTTPSAGNTDAPVVNEAAGGGGAPAAPATADELASLRKQLADTKAELTRRTQADTPAAKEPEAAPAPVDKPAAEATKEAPKEGDDKQIEAIKDAAKTANIDVDVYRKEFFDTGDLTEDSRAAVTPLAEQFFSHIADESARKAAASDLVTEYVEGRKAVMARDNARYEDLVGGKAEYDAMIAWAGSTMTQAEADAFNRQRKSGDVHSATLAVQGLQARYRASVGNRPKLTAATAPASPSSGVYGSFNDYVKDASDPRYSKDPSFRAECAAKLARSSFSK